MTGWDELLMTPGADTGSGTPSSMILPQAAARHCPVTLTAANVIGNGLPTTASSASLNAAMT